jgi:urease accessory protein
MTSAHGPETMGLVFIHPIPMHLIQRMLAERSELPADRQIILSAERRLFLKRRWRAVADDGTEFGFDLESRLADNCVIFHGNGCDYIVRQQTEKVFRIPFDNTAHAALVAWKTGNLHLPAQILDDAILVLHDEAAAQLLEREGWVFSEPEVLFTPMKAMAHTP